MAASSDSEQDFETEQDKILLDELSRQTVASAASRRRRPAELLPVGLDSDESSDGDEDDGDDDDEEDEEADEAIVGQYRDVLKRARLQRLRREIADDMGDGGDSDDGDDSDGDAGGKKWATSRRYRYAAGDSDDDEGDDGDDGDGDVGGAASTARLMREERERLRRRMLGVGVPSDLPDVAAAASTAAASSATSADSTRPRVGSSSALVRVASELPAYERPPPGVSLERHLLASGDRWPDMRQAFELKTRLEGRLQQLVGRPDSALTPRQAVLKWHYILLCAYLQMRANSAPGLHRHPVRRLLRRAGDAVQRLGGARASAPTSAPKTTPKPTIEEAGAGADEAAAAAAADADSSGHRPIYWEMQKNLPVQLHKRRRRQLAKKSKPGDSNPRVKLRDKYRRALIKRRSQVPEVRPEVNRYSGEASGIRAGLVKSRKFK